MIEKEFAKAIKKLSEPHKNKSSMARSAGLSNDKTYKLIRLGGDKCNMTTAIKLWNLFNMDRGVMAWDDVQRRLKDPAINLSYLARKAGCSATTVCNAKKGKAVSVETAQKLWDFFNLPQK